ncbi:MAG: septum formation initiator family protein [Spirochaetales bacterium]|nr:septum formation initiator family protein [Spirochaetales bacterium]
MTRNYMLNTLTTIVIIYVIITGLFGEKGYFVNRRLEQMIPALQNDLEVLLIENRELTDNKIRFESDYQKILEEAYRYGYLQENEFRIIYNSYTSYKSRLSSSAELGKRIDLPNGFFTQTQIIIISLGSGILLHLFMYTGLYLKRKRKKR